MFSIAADLASSKVRRTPCDHPPTWIVFSEGTWVVISQVLAELRPTCHSDNIKTSSNIAELPCDQTCMQTVKIPKGGSSIEIGRI